MRTVCSRVFFFSWSDVQSFHSRIHQTRTLKQKKLHTQKKYPYGEFDDRWSHANGASGNAIEM